MYVPDDSLMPYPRICAHRGYNAVAPENTMAAFSAAVKLNADEIEFDLRVTKDGEIVSCHDSSLERVSDGKGELSDYSSNELLSLDFGIKYGEQFKGLKIVRFEDILKEFAKKTIMNIHIKTPDNKCTYPEDIMQKIIDLIDKYDCRKHVYFMCGNDFVLDLARRLAPDICRCVGAGDEPYNMVARAIKYDCKKVQLFKGKFTKETILEAHQHGIICNLFWADDINEAKEFISMGIDTILTNDFYPVFKAIKGQK